MPVATASLEHLLGAQHLRTDVETLVRFRVDGRSPSAVAEPASAAELAEIIRWARENKAALAPATSGLYLPLGNPPAALDLGVSLARMNRVVHYDSADLTLTVEAGLPLAEAQRRLAEHKQFLPIDPPHADEAAVGGLVASNASGPLRFAYGTWRDFIVGMKFVTGEGTEVKTGGRVVKNVAGYDLAKLMIGALGTLGVITEVSFKVFPQAPATATFVFGFESLEAALETARRIVHSTWQPLLVELLSPQAGDLVSCQPLSPLHWSLVVAVGGVEPVLRRYQSDFGALARELRTAQLDIVRGHDEQFVLKAVRERIPRARKKNPAITVVKAALPLAGVGPFLAKAQQVAARYELPAAASAHAGSGIAYLFLMPELPDKSRFIPSPATRDEGHNRGGSALRSPEGAGGARHLSDAAKRMAQAATEMVHAGNNLGGRVTLPWCPTEVKHDVNVWGPLRDDFPLMQKLKKQFDPDRVLNPGRFLGGL
jgi:glycolate oxidase FAD binding subunit